MVYGLVARDLGISPNEVENMYVDRLEDVLESWRDIPPFAAITTWKPRDDSDDESGRHEMTSVDIAELRERLG